MNKCESQQVQPEKIGHLQGWKAVFGIIITGKVRGWRRRRTGRTGGSRLGRRIGFLRGILSKGTIDVIQAVAQHGNGRLLQVSRLWSFQGKLLGINPIQCLLWLQIFKESDHKTND